MSLATLMPALLTVAALGLVAGGVWLLRAPTVYLLALHVISRVILDSAADITYQKVAAGLSIMQLYSVAFIGLGGLHLLWQRRLYAHAYTLPLVAIIGAALLSTAINGTYTDLISLVLRWLYLWVLVGLTLSALKQQAGRPLMGALAVAGLYAFLNIVYSIVTDQPKWGAGQWSYVGTYHHESDVCFLMILLIIPGLYLLTERRSLLGKGFGIACVLAAHVGLAYAAYRSLWVAAAGYWAFYVWTRYQRGSVSRRAMWMLSSLCGVMLLVAVAGPSVVEKMADLGDFAANPSQYLDFSGDAKEVYLMSGRVDLINSYMALYLNSGVHVWAAGIGPGQGADAVGLYAHNEYLSALVETGLLGLAALLWFLLRITRDSFAVVRDSDAVAQACAPYLMVVIVASLGTMPFQDMRAVMTIGIVLGVLVHRAEQQREVRRRTTRPSREGPDFIDLAPVQMLR